MIHALAAAAAAPEPALTLEQIKDPAAIWAAYGDTLIGWVLNLAAAAAILIIGLWIACGVRGFIRRRAEKSARMDATLGAFFSSIAFYAIAAFVVIAVLGRFGVQTTSLVAVFGAATLAIGFALQGTLGNVAAGVMLVFFRPYRIGDYVIVAGHEGTVKEMNIFTTEIRTVHNVLIIVPNGEAWGTSITNFSRLTERRCDITFGVAYDTDLDLAMAAILEVANADARVLKAPAEPWVRVVELADSSVNLQLRFWAAPADFWDAKFAMIKGVKEAFDAKGVEIPFPHQVEIQKQAGPKRVA